MTYEMSRGRRAVQTSADEPTVLVLLGGGGQGAYHAGVYAALSANGHMPDWISGRSIGALDPAPIKMSLEAPSFLLKIVPDVDCRPKVCELGRDCLEDLTVKGAPSWPAAHELHPHALAPVADWPAIEVVLGPTP
jgi:hypothetical protein